MVRNLSFIFTSLLLQVSDFYFIEGVPLEEIFIITLSPDFHANLLFLSVFFPRQLFDSHSFMGIPGNGNSITLKSCARILAN